MTRHLSRVVHCVILIAISCAIGLRSGEAAGPGLHGRVFALDKTGHYVKVIGGARIEFKDQSGQVAAEATSGANGYYRAELGPGSYTYKVEADGYQTEDEGRGLELQQTTGYQVHDFPLGPDDNVQDDQPYAPEPIPIGQLTGRVVEINDKGERVGIAQARIALRLDDDARLRSVRSRRSPGNPNEVGTYTIQLAAGTWHASVSAKGFEPLLDPNPIEISAGETAKRDFVLKRTTSEVPTDQGLRGVVRVPRGRQLPQDVVVQIDPLTMGPTLPADSPVQPDETGRFQRNLPAGKYRLLAQAKGYRPAVRSLVIVFPGRYSHVELLLIPEPSDGAVPETTLPENLIVRVSVSEQIDKNIRGIKGSRVMLRRSNQELRDAVVSTTDAQGQAEFEVASTEAGDYAALAQADGYTPGGAKLVVGPQESNRVEILLRKADSETPEGSVNVTGYAAYRDKASPTGLYGVPGTELVWRPSKSPDAAATLTSETQGQFSVSLPPGTYVVDVDPPDGFTDRKAEVTVRLGMKPITIILERAAQTEDLRPVQVTGAVVTAPVLKDGRPLPVPNAQVRWTGVPGKEVTVATDRSGRFAATLVPDRYAVHVSAEGYESLDDSIAVAEGMDPVRLVLNRNRNDGAQPLATLLVRVTQRPQIDINPRSRIPAAMARAKPITDAKITIRSERAAAGAGSTDAKGLYSVDLQPGRYTASVSHEGFEPVQHEVNLSPQGQTVEITLTPKVVAQPEQQQQHWLTVRVVEQVAKPPQTQNQPEQPKEQQQPERRKPRRIIPFGPRSTTRPGESSEVEKAVIAEDETFAQRTPRRSTPQLLQIQSRRQSQRGTSGTAPKQEIQPVASATVTVYSGQTKVASGQSDQTGVYRVQLSPGTYRIEVSRQGFETAQQAAAIADNDLTRQVVLRRKQ